METTFKIYVADLAKYNEGILKGEWFDLFDFSDKDELLEAIAEMLGNNEEWAIHDTDTEIEGIGEYTSLDTLFTIKDYLEDDEEKTLAFIEYFGIRELETMSEWDDVRLYNDVNDNDDLGQYWLVDSGCYDIPKHLEHYIDYEKFGRDYAMDVNGGFTSYGFIEWL